MCYLRTSNHSLARRIPLSLPTRVAAAAAGPSLPCAAAAGSYPSLTHAASTGRRPRTPPYHHPNPHPGQRAPPAPSPPSRAAAPSPPSRAATPCSASFLSRSTPGLLPSSDGPPHLPRRQWTLPPSPGRHWTPASLSPARGRRPPSFSARWPAPLPPMRVGYGASATTVFSCSEAYFSSTKSSIKVHSCCHGHGASCVIQKLVKYMRWTLTTS